MTTLQQLFHSPAQPAATDERYTPRWVFDGLALEFDLDPASPIGCTTFVPARHRYTVTDDGLTQPWHGTVWCNPPFSGIGSWVQRFIDHGNGIILVPATDSTWLPALAAQSDRTAICQGFEFHTPDRNLRKAGFAAIIFAAIGLASTAALHRLADSGRINMTLLHLAP